MPTRRPQPSYDEVREAVAAIPDGPAPEATARTLSFGDVNCKEWMAFAYVHSRDHSNQIERTKAVWRANTQSVSG